MTNEMVDNGPQGPILEVIHENKMSEIAVGTRVWHRILRMYGKVVQDRSTLHHDTSSTLVEFEDGKEREVTTALLSVDPASRLPSAPVEDTLPSQGKGGLELAGKITKEDVDFIKAMCFQGPDMTERQERRVRRIIDEMRLCAKESSQCPSKK